MTVQVDFWHLVGLLLGFLGFCAGAGKVLLSQSQKHLDERFTAMSQSQSERFAEMERARTTQHDQLSRRLDGIEQVNREETVQWQRVERELLNLKADLPLNYVRREDYVQAIATIMTKLDAMALRFENILLRGESKRDAR